MLEVEDPSLEGMGEVPEELLSFDVGVMLGAEFLQDEEGMCAHKGVGREFGGDYRLGLVVTVV